MKIELGDYSTYTLIKYPAGELEVRLTKETMANLNPGPHNYFLFRAIGPEKMLEAALLIDAVHRFAGPANGFKYTFPYFPYSRNDKVFVDGGSYGRRLTSDLFIGYPLETFDIHSEYAGVANIDPDLTKLIQNFAAGDNEVNVIFPDYGASKRYTVPDIIQNNVRTLKINKFNCDKVRNKETGKFEHFSVPKIPNVPTLVIDDICDGGKTFIGIAEAMGLRNSGLPRRFSLYVSHGIFSQGLEQLKFYYDKIYTTDSFRKYEDYLKLFNHELRCGNLEINRLFF